MDIVIVEKLARNIIIGLIFLVLVFAMVKMYISIKFEKRIKNFALEISDDGKVSFIDCVINKFFSLVKKLSKSLKKSHVAQDYSKHLEKYLNYNDIKITSIDFISIKVLCMLLIQLLYLFTLLIKFTKFSLIQFILVSIISFFSIDLFLVLNFKNKKKLMEEQLLQAVVIMNSAFKSGKNIYQAVEIAKKELPLPMKEEFNIISKDISYGLELEVVFNRFYNRIKVEEAKYITSSLALLSKTGGNIVSVFNMIEKNFYNRLKIKNELESLTSSSRFLYKMLLFLPLVFILVIVMLNPSYFEVLLTTKVGLIIDIIMLVLFVCYIILIKKIMKVDEV